MAEFSIDYKKCISAVDEISSCKSRMSSIHTRLEAVRFTLDAQDAAMASIKKTIQNISSNCAKQKNSLANLSTGLKLCAENYRDTEKQIVDEATKWSFGGFGKEGAVVSGGVSGSWIVNGLPVSAEAKGDLIGGSVEVHSGINVKYDEDGKLDEAGAGIGGEAQGHLAHGEGSVTIGNTKTTGEVNVGKVSAEGEVGLSLYKDGKLAPGIKAGVGATAVGIEGSITQQTGSDEYNIHRKAEGQVGVASAEAEAGAGVITYKDGDGNVKTGVGVKAEAKAEAYAAQGKVQTGVTICGVKIDVGVTGKAGGAGVGVGGHATTGSVGGEVDLGLGVGAGLSIDIDFSDFKLPKLPKLPKFKK